MCTAATYKTNDFYMGRTLDYEFSYGDEITVTPRNYSFTLRHGGKLENHYAIIGMAHVAGNYPLYYDAINEKGLGIAGLNFVGNATYKPVDPSSSKHQITVAFRAKCKMFSRHLQKPILKTEKGRFKGL